MPSEPCEGVALPSQECNCAGQKRFVAEAVSFDQMQDRFGKVVMGNQAEWKQKIARKCASIAMA